MRFRLLVLVWAFACTVPTSTFAQVDTSAAREARAAARLIERTYGRNSRWPEWARQLRWPDLVHELKAGDQADVTSLERAVKTLRSPTPVEFRAASFQSLAAAFEARVKELQPVPATEWAALARENAAKFAPVSESQSQTARERVRQTLDALERRVPALRSKDNNWATFLSWSKTRELADPSLETPLTPLGELEVRWNQVLLVWDDPEVIEASLAVRSLIPLLRAKLVGENEDEHRSAWESIAAAAESRDDPEKLLQMIAERESLGQGSPLTLSIRRELATPNAIIELSTDWFKRQAVQEINETYRINGFYAGASARGSGRITGKLDLAIDRSAAASSLVLNLAAVSRSSSTGGRDGVSVSSRATTSISGQKHFTLDGVGLRARPATAAANTSIAYDSVAAGGGRRGSIGTSEAYGSRPQAEADASEEAANGARTRLDAHGREWMSAFNREYQEQFRNPWLATPRLAPVVRVRAQDGKVSWLQQLAPLRGFETSTRPDFSATGDATIRLAASAIEEHLQATYGERQLTGAEFSKSMASWLGKSAESEESLDLTVRFAALPCDVSLADGELQCTLHFAEFQSGETAYPPLRVELRYKFEPRDRGLALVRVAAPKVALVRDKADDGPVTGREQTLRIGAQRKIARLLVEELNWPHVRLPIGSGPPQKFDVAELLADKNWLQIALIQQITTGSSTAARTNSN